MPRQEPCPIFASSRSSGNKFTLLMRQQRHAWCSLRPIAPTVTFVNDGANAAHPRWSSGLDTSRTGPRWLARTAPRGNTSFRGPSTLRSTRRDQVLPKHQDSDHENPDEPKQEPEDTARADQREDSHHNRGPPSQRGSASRLTIAMPADTGAGGVGEDTDEAIWTHIESRRRSV
jgi:hypothetical protein